MIAEDLNILVSNVVSESPNKHCRLCLREVTDCFINFSDFVSYDEVNFQPLHQLLTELFGKQILDKVPGVDTVCPECLQKVLGSYNFIQETKRNTQVLYKTFNNLFETLSINLKITDTLKRLYVVVGKEESVIMLIDKNDTNRDVYEDSPKIQVIDRKTLPLDPVCEKCNYIASSNAALKDHKKEHRCFKCTHCNEGFRSEKKLNHHEELEHLIRFCTQCGEVCDGLNKLVAHEKMHHSKRSVSPNENVEAVQDDFEDEQNDHHDEQDNHQDEKDDQIVNQGEPTFKCKQCGKICDSLSKLKYHEERHSSRSECPKCKKVYLTKDCFIKHVDLCLSEKLELHPFRSKMEKKFRCDQCDKGYSCQAGLKVHKKFVHDRNCQRHICEVCGKVFSASSYLKNHMIKHTGAKDFNCKICNKNFVSKEALLYHTRRHTGEKPYSCNLCDKRFVNASARADHIKFKHQSPKYSCDICNKKLFTKNFLKTHILKHSDPQSKLFTGRLYSPANEPTKENMRVKRKYVEKVEKPAPAVTLSGKSMPVTDTMTLQDFIGCSVAELEF